MTHIYIYFNYKSSIWDENKNDVHVIFKLLNLLIINYYPGYPFFGNSPMRPHAPVNHPYILPL